MRLAILLVLAALITACEPTAQATPTPVPTATLVFGLKQDEFATAVHGLPLDLWKDVWTEGTVEEDRLLATDTTITMGEPERAVLLVMCAEELRATEVRIGLYFEEVADAREADDEVDDIFISRRSKGETGRWMKSGWQHWADGKGYLVLSHRPAGAFIDALAMVEELAVMVTYDDHGNDSGAVFDVRYLSAALNTPGWVCE